MNLCAWFSDAWSRWQNPLPRRSNPTPSTGSSCLLSSSNSSLTPYSSKATNRTSKDNTNSRPWLTVYKPTKLVEELTTLPTTVEAPQPPVERTNHCRLREGKAAHPRAPVEVWPWPSSSNAPSSSTSSPTL